MHFKRVTSVLSTKQKLFVRVLLVSRVILPCPGMARFASHLTITQGSPSLVIVLRLCFIQWERITASRIATIYFAFSILNCVLQVVFRAQAFSINVQADNFLSGLISTGNISLPTGFFVLDSELHFCDHLPSNSSTKSCQIVWGGEIGDTDNSTTSVTPLTLTTTVSVTSLTATPTAQALVRDVGTQSHHDKRFLPRVDGYRRTSSHGQTGVKLTSLEIDGKDITLDSKCLVNLMWPVQT